MNLLFTNIGRRNYLIDFSRSIDKLNLFVSDSDELAPGVLEDDIKFIRTPRVSNDHQYYVDFLLEKCISNNIDIVFPLLDYELPIISKNKDKFLSKNIFVCISDFDFINNTLNKLKTYQNYKHLINFPKTYTKKEEIPPDIKILKKKIIGSASIGIEFYKDKSTISNFCEGVDILQEQIIGDEYGMDILNDLEVNFVHSSFRKKLSMRAGETDKAITFFEEELWNLAISLSKTFRHIGNIDIDFIKENDTDKIFIIDINPRFGGGYPFTHLSGYNYIESIINMILKKDFSIKKFKKSIKASKGIKVFSMET